MKKLLFLFILILSSMLASAQTVSDVQNSGCTARARGVEGEELVPTMVLTKEGNILSVEVLNYEANCCTEYFSVTPNISGGSDGEPCSAFIHVVPVGGYDCDCECPFNVSFTIRDLEPNSFYLDCWWYKGQVEMTEGKPLVLEYKIESVIIDGISFNLLKVMHKAKLTKWTTEEKEIHIPSEVTYEGENYTVTSIDHDAFRDLDHVAKITIPRTIRSTDLDVDGIIWANPFRECKSLEWIEVEKGCPLLSSVDGVLFAENKTMLLGYPIASSKETYTVPEGVTNIRSGAFYHNKYLRKLVIPDGVTYLGWHLFDDTKSLEALYIRGVLNSECLNASLFGGMSTTVIVYVQPSEVEKFKSIYKGPVYPLPEQPVGDTTYLPFLGEGKVWTYHYHGLNGQEFNVDRIIDGDTIIGGLTYKKIYDKVGGQYQYALREDGKKIYIVYPHYETASLLYDFSKNAGDVINELAYPLIVASVDTIDIDGVKFRRMRVQDANQPVKEWSDDLIHLYNFWIEGVGSECLLEASIREPGNAYNLVSCQINGRVYTQQELLGIVSKPTPQNDYIPFVKEGKKWNVVRSDFDGGYHFDQFTLMNEAIIKDGKTYMKMHRSEDNLTVTYDAGLLREEDRKVYFFDSDMQNEFLLFDYSLKTGDTYETYSYDEQRMVSYKVVSVGDYWEGPKIVRYDYDQVADSMTTQYRYLRKWTVRRTDIDLEKTWIEGVGSLEGPLANLYDERPVSSMDYLAYVEFVGEDAFSNPYLPFTFYDTLNRRVHGCDLTTVGKGEWEDDWHHHLTYELEGNRLHVYGKAFANCGRNNYAYFYEEKTDDPLVNKIKFVIQEVEPIATCKIHHPTDFYVPGFDPNMNYIVVDNNGEEHPVINKTPQMAYRPFVEDGKVWKVGTISGNPVQVVDYYYFDGDTIIDGKTCKQMMCQRFVNPDYSNEYWTPTPSLSKVGAWYEEDKKVYFYDDGQKSMRMMYDFSLNAYDTLQINNEFYVIGPKQTGGIKGFKGVYRNIMGVNIDSRIYTAWLEGVGDIYGPTKIPINPILGDPVPEFLMACAVGDEVIYLNDEYEDGATPETSNAPKQRLDFTHIIKTKPKAPIKRENSDACISYSEREVARPKVKTPMMRTAEQSLYGEYNDLQLGINLDPLAEAYLVRINDASGKAVYEKAINAGNIVGLNIDISAYPKGCYTVTIENSSETFTGQFETESTGISDAACLNDKEEMINDKLIYNLLGQRISTLQKGLNIVNGRKVYIK